MLKLAEVIAVGLEKNMPTSMSNAKARARKSDPNVCSTSAKPIWQVIRALDGKALMLPPHMPRALTEGASPTS